ncbi:MULTISPECIES: hypothetical protein [Actinosynnema]|uniref:hypothetical protein n=1 Tax=Actinosynnema TaxID=40566 RepID=UPI0020A40D52|nr:hypothetical protein [Actinosynnema pretiosum]MCP2093844.1 hypothetical protein [Actinosynnema pretiosum]
MTTGAPKPHTDSARTDPARTDPARTDPARTALLRLALKADGVASAACGALVPLVPVDLGLPRPLVLGLGAFLLAYGACAFLAGLRPTRPRALAVVLFNTAWVLGSALVLLVDLFPLTTTGLVLLQAQALAVAAITAVQVVGLRRTS